MSRAFWKKRSKPPEPVKCPYCGGTRWHEGPSGGMSTNILCANPECRHWFNFTPIINTLDDLHRTEPTEDEERELARLQSFERASRFVGPSPAAAGLEARREEGRQAYRAGESIETLRKDPPYGGYAEASTNIDRMCGYLDAMAEDVRRSIETVSNFLFEHNANMRLDEIPLTERDIRSEKRDDK